MHAELMTRFLKMLHLKAGSSSWWFGVCRGPCLHPDKYRLVFLVEGQRIVGFDKERGKGDHSHLSGIERPYSFTDVDQLITDFIVEAERWRNAR